MDYPNRYRALRKQAGITAERASVELDVSMGTLLSWERGETSPKGYHVSDMSRLYGCTADELLGITTSTTD